jgi:hypothetical protein
MRLSCRKDHWVLILTTFCLVLCMLSGCAVGPTSVKMGRAAYNEAINETEDEQMLMSIVKGRYGETFSLLAVNGVAANVRFFGEAAPMSESALARTILLTSFPSAPVWPTRRTPRSPIRLS